MINATCPFCGGGLVSIFSHVENCTALKEAAEILSDRSDLQPAVTLWPSPQVPQFLRKDEQPSDLRMTEEW